MQQLNIPQVEWVREYLKEHYPGQPFPERAGGIATVILDVNDSHGRPKELRISREFLLAYNKAAVQEYLKNANIVQQIEDVPSSVSIVKPLR